MTRSRILFGGAVFLGAFLLFLVEPIAAKQLLPALGGSAAVWITCLVFFQTALLCAYLYAHWLARSSRWMLHLVLLASALVAAVAWTLHSFSLTNASDHPVTAVFVALSTWIGLPFLALGATSPLLQIWWAHLHRTAIPYRLFALSNLASLLALGLYPSVVEPHLTLAAQRITWTIGFAVFAVLSAILTVQTRNALTAGEPALAAESTMPAAPLWHKLLWVLLPMGAAMQLSAVTAYLTANVAAIPLLWILPLAAYLLTLILAFEFPRLLPRGIVTRLLIVMLGSLAYMLAQTEVSLPLRVSIAFFLIEVFVACYFCHSEAYALRPQRSSESTLFYLLFAAGGALGAFLIGIASPLLFRFNYDLAITFLVTALLAFVVTWRDGWSQRMLWGVACALLAVLVSWLQIAYQLDTVAAVRNFYGTLRVRQNRSYPGAVTRTLLNGTIQHGTQYFGSEQLRHTPTSYYAEDSGVGLALRFCCDARPRSIGVIGLGAGTIAAYGRPGDHIDFYEINPAVPPIAANVFTYLRDSGAQIHVIDGDGRLSLAREQSQHFDVLVVDAFSGDAIPLHLLTTQALALYRRNLAPGGIIAFHISNKHVDLEAAIALLAKDAGMIAMRVTNGPNDELGEFSSSWMLVSGNAAFFSKPEIAPRACTPESTAGLRVWSDDYSSLLPVLHW
ncbi:MAG: fused MFS/spermidine synthase [Terracidiphilus sp.]